MQYIEYLKDPLLVSRIQKYFGVKLVEKSEKNGIRSVYKKGPSNDFVVTNRFWYYLFTLGTALGDEVFYTCFIPFWFWNIDGAVGRRFVLVWAIVMYIGQGIKDILRWERPGYPVVKLHSKWALEYGMPSTHAMVGVSLPFSVLLYTMDRYQYYFPIGLTIAVVWCGLICVSRIYLGMHTVLDVIAGLLLAITLMVPLVPLVDQLDIYFLTSPTSPILLLVVSILMIVYYPNSGKWTPTRGDTTMIISVTVGLLFGSWINYQMGLTSISDLKQPYVIMWPSQIMLLCTVLRTIIGFLFVFMTRVCGDSVAYVSLCALLKEDVDNLKKSKNSLQNKHKTFVDLSCKYFTCAIIGFSTAYVLPRLFKLMRIERSTLYTEL